MNTTACLERRKKKKLMRSSSILLCLLLISLLAFSPALNIVLHQPPKNIAFAQQGSGVQSNISFGSYEMIQYPLPNGSASPWSIAVDNSGRIWFVEQDPSALMLFNPNTENYTQYLIPSNQNISATPESVTIDKFGNVWFSELGTDKLGELKNGSNSLEQYSIPGSFATVASTKEALPCGPTIVKSDPAGNIWIACDFANQITEFLPINHTFLSYNLPLWQSAPAGFVFDNQGNLWFTAADADMIGHAVLNQLVNGSDNGISEFPPINSTYTYTFPHAKSLGGQVENLTSSLPTPSGIALSRDGTTLWITEHVDSSFDSYNLVSHSLVKYWTSQTYDEYGYSVSFPNGIAIDGQGNIWISEHYGNRIAKFIPATGQLYEYPIPHYGGPYNLALGPNGSVWFVEISGASIGELKPTNTNVSVFINPRTSTLSLAPGGSLSVPFVCYPLKSKACHSLADLETQCLLALLQNELSSPKVSRCLTFLRY